MISPAKLNEYNHAETPARLLLERLGWTYVPREALAAERGLVGDRLGPGVDHAAADGAVPGPEGNETAAHEPGASPTTVRTFCVGAML